VRRRHVKPPKEKHAAPGTVFLKGRTALPVEIGETFHKSPGGWRLCRKWRKSWFGPCWFTLKMDGWTELYYSINMYLSSAKHNLFNTLVLYFLCVYADMLLMVLKSKKATKKEVINISAWWTLIGSGRWNQGAVTRAWPRGWAWSKAPRTDVRLHHAPAGQVE